MYIIHLKGKAAPLEVDATQGKRIKELWAEDPKSESPIEVRDRMFRLSQINSIEPVAPSRSDREPEPEALPLSDEERRKVAAIASRVAKELRAKGVLGKEAKPNNLTWHKYCVECGRENPPGLATTCSGECYVKFTRRNPAQSTADRQAS